MEQDKDLRLAVLIDAENVPSVHLKEMMEEIATYGTPTFKRIYADWTKPHVNRWKSVLLENALTPIQQYSYTQGKNASDSAMIIDAMDILYTGRVDGFCIVSSDSDFTRLALRLREAGMRVIGMGEKKTPEPFIASCDKFIYIEILSADRGRGNKTDAGSATDGQTRDSQETEMIKKVDSALLSLITSVVTDLSDESGWAFLGDIGNLILKKKPDFDPRNYGFKRLALLIKSTGAYEIDERTTEKGNVNSKRVYVRVQTTPKAKTRKSSGGRKTGAKSTAKSKGSGQA